MITKSIVKNYIQRRCPYFVKAFLSEGSLINLIEQYLEFGGLDTLDESENVEKGEGEDVDEEIFNLTEISKDHPELKKKIDQLIFEHQKTNPLYSLLQKYEDTQVTSRLTRRYFELTYGKDKCARCDLNAWGVETYSQKDIVQKTNEYLKDPNIKVLFEGQVESDDLRARFDILIKNDDGSYTLIEAKGTNSVFAISNHDYSVHNRIKSQYLYDLLFQYYLYKKAGLNLSSVGFMYLNRDFKYSDGKESYPELCDEDVLNLFKVTTDINLKIGKEKTQLMSIMEYIDSERYVDEQKTPKIEDVIYEIRKIGQDSSIKPSRHYECVKGGKCPFIQACFKDANEPNSIFRLTRWNLYCGNYTKSRDFINNGIFNIDQIPTAFIQGLEDKYDKETGILLKHNNCRTQIRYQTDLKSSNLNYFVDKNMIRDILYADYDNENIDYLVFFDFESIQNPVPLMKDAHPWQQVVTQYSMHIVGRKYDLEKHDFDKGRGGNISHYEFIGHPSKDGYTNPEFDLFKTLRDQLIDFGVDPMAKNYRVVVFNKNFEKTRMDEFVRLYSSHKDVDADLVNFVSNFNDNVVDLLDFFTSGSIYGRDFNGRGSLKVVQPTLCSEPKVLEYYHSLNLPFDFEYSLDYHKGDKCLVYNGGICLDLYKALLVRNHAEPLDNDPDENKMLAEALAYCKIDSWGTVILYDILKNISVDNIKLNAIFI